ncbi:MAG: L-aspartate oxidase [Deltaproteobacteria bacterium]|nr:L-aspartate oxidase [Deltaproteobacteria bacterium]
MARQDDPRTTDFLVLGSGIAGLAFALEAARHGRVLIVTKRAPEDGSTAWAQGGIAAVVGPDDSFEEHVKDTLEAGAGLCNPDTVRFVVERGPAAIEFLVRSGAEFAHLQGKAAGYDLGREGGHHRRRVLHAGDITGAEISRALIARARATRNITFLADHHAVDLITARRLGHAQDACLGAYILQTATGTVLTVLARRAVVLATGGAGKTYLYTTNPDTNSGDGMAMAYRAGAPVADMEFMQFHPTCLYHPEAKSFLISEALRGEGGTLRRRDGTAFMEGQHPLASLAPRDIVARAIDAELKRTGDDFVTLDMTHKSRAFLRKRFPNIFDRCLQYGIDMARTPIPVVPAAHYTCGGVVTDRSGRTSIPRLYAVGEVACTGLHGANRLASNSLLEGVVFGRAAAADAGALAPREVPGVPPWNPGAAVPQDEGVVVTQNWDEIRRLMWNFVGIVRSDKRLTRALRRLMLLQQEIQEYYWAFHVTRDLVELRNLVVVADLIVRSAATRRESRGLHFNLDVPDRDETGWGKRDTVLLRGREGPLTRVRCGEALPERLG